MDLMEYIDGRVRAPDDDPQCSLRLDGASVVELGCGFGLPGIACCKHYNATRLLLQDYNEEVLVNVTARNARLNLAPQQLSPSDGSDNSTTDVDFVAGDWWGMRSYLESTGTLYSFDLVVSTETAYNVDNLESLVDAIHAVSNTAFSPAFGWSVVSLSNRLPRLQHRRAHHSGPVCIAHIKPLARHLLASHQVSQASWDMSREHEEVLFWRRRRHQRIHGSSCGTRGPVLVRRARGLRRIIERPRHCPRAKERSVTFLKRITPPLIVKLSQCRRLRPEHCGMRNSQREFNAASNEYGVTARRNLSRTDFHGRTVYTNRQATRHGTTRRRSCVAIDRA